MALSEEGSVLGSLDIRPPATLTGKQPKGVPQVPSCGDCKPAPCVLARRRVGGGFSRSCQPISVSGRSDLSTKSLKISHFSLNEIIKFRSQILNC